MKVIFKLRQQLASMGATLDVSDYSLNCDAPIGYVWTANGCCAYSIPYATNSQQWLSEAIRAEMPSLKLGLRKVTDPDEIAEKRFELGDDEWGAPENAPDVIKWPSKQTK